jgi:hypothetical protein
MLSNIKKKRRGGEEYQKDIGVAFIVLGELRLVRYLGLNLINSLLGEGVVTINLLFYY